MIRTVVTDTMQRQLHAALQDFNDAVIAQRRPATMGELMVEAEELIATLNQPATWGGRVPRCASPSGVHVWQGTLQRTVRWKGHWKLYDAVYPVAVVCRHCEWMVGLHNESVDPLDSVGSLGNGG